MKNILNKISLLVIATFLAACSTNNVFDDLGQTDGSSLANVYLEVLAPKIQAGTSKDMEVQFWSLDDDFIYTGLWNYVSRVQVFKTTIDEITFEVAVDDEFHNWTEYEEYSFSFADWTPDRNAYVKSINYAIDIAYDEISEGSGDITIAAFQEAIPENYEIQMFDFYTSALSRTTLNDLMLDNAIMTQLEFDGQYGDNGFLSDDGKIAIRVGLEQVGIAALVGNNYRIDTEYEIILAFRVINGSQKPNESRRSFGVF